jgi:uncharacterized protein (DUF2147 family)
VYDPEDGRDYYVDIGLAGDRLTLPGFIAFLCDSGTWTRCRCDDMRVVAAITAAAAHAAARRSRAHHHQISGVSHPAAQEGLRCGRVAGRAPVAVGKKMNRIGGQHVVEINADIRKFSK